MELQDIINLLAGSPVKPTRFTDLPEALNTCTDLMKIRSVRNDSEAVKALMSYTQECINLLKE